MALPFYGAAVQGVEDLFDCGNMVGLPDNEIVALFLSHREGRDAAFRALNHRHGAMVLGVCRRVLGDHHAAEDAFQTTFMVHGVDTRSLDELILTGGP